MKRWYVVQDLSPFGIRVESKHFTKAGARSACSSRYLQVMRREEVDEHNKYLSNYENFKKELKQMYG